MQLSFRHAEFELSFRLHGFVIIPDTNQLEIRVDFLNDAIFRRSSRVVGIGMMRQDQFIPRTDPIDTRVL